MITIRWPQFLGFITAGTIGLLIADSIQPHGNWIYFIGFTFGIIAEKIDRTAQ